MTTYIYHVFNKCIYILNNYVYLILCIKYKYIYNISVYYI